MEEIIRIAFSIVATSPVPLGNTVEAKPDNNTAAVNYSTTFPSAISTVKTTKAPTPSFEFVTAPKGAILYKLILFASQAIYL